MRYFWRGVCRRWCVLGVEGKADWGWGPQRGMGVASIGCVRVRAHGCGNERETRTSARVHVCVHMRVRLCDS